MSLDLELTLKLMAKGENVQRSGEIIIPIYDGVTQLDFTGPHELLARMPHSRVVVASLNGRSVTADSQLQFCGLKSLETVHTSDVLCVPGGPSSTEAMDALDSPYADPKDAEGLRLSAEKAKLLGMVGKAARHPDQVRTLRETFTPQLEDIARARKIVSLFDASPRGTIVYEGKIVNCTTIDRFRRIARLQTTA